MPDEDEKSLVRVSDLFGLSKGADRLVQAIERGVGNLLAPWQKARTVKADIAGFESWSTALARTGLAASRVSLTLEDRSSVRVVAEQIRHQDNRESIAHQSTAEFKEEQHNSSDKTLNSDPLEPEWIDRFWRLAQDVSDADMQSVWARVLARQAAGTGKYSARCLEALSLLSYAEAQSLEHIASISAVSEYGEDSDWFVITNVSTGLFDDQVADANKRLKLAAGNLYPKLFGPFGIYLDSGGTSWAYNVHLPFDGNTSAIRIANKPYKLVSSEAPPQGHLSIGAGTGISPLGAEILSLVKTKPNKDYVLALSDALKFKRIEIRPS